MKHILTLLALALAALPGMLRAQPALSFEQTAQELGTLLWHTPRTATFKFTNKGTRDLTILDVRTDCGCTVAQLIASPELRKKININHYVSAEVGLPTLTDIMQELEKPGRDPRKGIGTMAFDDNITDISQLHPGMELNGIVSNLTQFGAFVDIGVHQDGLVHISQLADKYVSNPSDVVKLHQHVMVKVTDVDTRRNRISLTMRGV